MLKFCDLKVITSCWQSKPEAPCSAYKQEWDHEKASLNVSKRVGTHCCCPQSTPIIRSFYWIVILTGLFNGRFNSLLVSTDTHWKAFGIPPSCNILIFAFLRILTMYQVTVTVILRWHILLTHSVVGSCWICPCNLLSKSQRPEIYYLFLLPASPWAYSLSFVLTLWIHHSFKFWYI